MYILTSDNNVGSGYILLL